MKQKKITYLIFGIVAGILIYASVQFIEDQNTSPLEEFGNQIEEAGDEININLK